MQKKKLESEIIHKRPNIYIVTVCENTKVIEQKKFYFVNEAFIYARDKRAEGYTCEQRTVHNPYYRGELELCGGMCHNQKHLPINTRTGWAQKVLCVDTGAIYMTMRECENSVGISGYRIRNAIRKGVRVEGILFQYA